MTVIRIDPGQVETTGNQFNSKSDELNALIGQANSLMTSLEGAFTGQRATAIFGEWKSMQPGLKNAVETLRQASVLLKRAATDFRAADSGK
ncbi:MAG TPA: WXG100 family type VII secretion target [Anaerolineaceae bacterium]|jgi:WXG100 family type VII secretion target|nr:WXG100 family type VII secretion target [Anaerolineaceae bacterium]HQP09575.1 WXG100 family type VII secretion target [Anaerolineaceae bacterium]